MRCVQVLGLALVLASINGVLPERSYSRPQNEPQTIRADLPFLVLKEPGTTVIVSGGTVAHLELRGTAHLVIEKGGEVSHLNLYDAARAVIEKDAKVSHATARDRAWLDVSGRVSNLTLYGDSTAVLDGASIEGGGHTGSAMGNVQIVLAPGSTLEVHASDVSFYDRAIVGTWRGGRRFSVFVGLNLGTEEHSQYREALALPSQVRIVDIAGPSFDCEEARTGNERRICASRLLARLDRRVSNLFAFAISQAPSEAALQGDQRAWLQSRDACRTAACLERTYRDRLTALSHFTGDFDAEYAGKLCGELLEPDSRGTLLDQVAGSDDVNNDGTPERIETCWGGTMNTPCTEYKDSTGADLPIEMQDFEWKDYWTYGEQRFRYDDKTFIYHSFDDFLGEPAYVSYVTPLNRESMVCDFENQISSVRVQGDRPVCGAIERGDAEVRAVPMTKSADRVHPAFGRSETGVVASGGVDLDNDGSPERVAELEYASGGGRGCYFNYFELTVADGMLRRDPVSKLVNELQDLPERGFEGRSCGTVRNRIIEYQGRIYFESNVNNSSAVPHRIRSIENGQVHDLCEFGRKVVTSIKSLR